MKNKKRVYETITRIDLSFKTMSESFNILVNLKKEFKDNGKYEKFINSKLVYRYDGDHFYIGINGERIETDKEYEDRIKEKEKIEKDKKKYKKEKEKQEKEIKETHRKIESFKILAERHKKEFDEIYKKVNIEIKYT